MTVPPSLQIVTSLESKLPEKKQRNSVTLWIFSTWRLVLSELVSTCLLLLLGCMSCLPLHASPMPMYAPLGFGFVVMLLVQTFGHVSGAHMNPAVTLAALLWGSVSLPLALLYAIAQCTGAVLGYGLLLAVAPVDLTAERVCVTALHPGLSVYQAVAIEVALTTALNLLNCGVWDPVNQHKMDSMPVKFALAIAGLSLAGGPLTGASMNPARSLAPALLTGAWDHQWVYWAGPMVGGLVAPLLYKMIWLRRDRDDDDE